MKLALLLVCFVYVANAQKDNSEALTKIFNDLTSNFRPANVQPSPIVGDVTNDFYRPIRSLTQLTTKSSKNAIKSGFDKEAIKFLTAIDLGKSHPASRYAWTTAIRVNIELGPGSLESQEDEVTEKEITSGKTTVLKGSSSISFDSLELEIVQINRLSSLVGLNSIKILWINGLKTNWSGSEITSDYADRFPGWAEALAKNRIGRVFTLWWHRESKRYDLNERFGEQVRRAG